MNAVNRAIVLVLALVGIVLAIACMLIPLATFDVLVRSMNFIRSQALIYSSTTRLLAGMSGLLLLGFAIAQVVVRRPTFVPIRNTGRGNASLDLRTVQQAVTHVLARSLDLAEGKATVQGFSEGVAIYLDVQFHAADYLTNKVAALHESIRDDVEERLGVNILTLKTDVAGKPYLAAARGGNTPADESPREPAWDTRELRRRLERSILNQAGVADLECKIGYHPDGASLFMQVFIDPDVNAPALIARIEQLARAIVEDDFDLALYDLRVKSDVVAG